MIKSWRRRRAERRARNNQNPDKISDLMIPNHFRCPISLDLMKDPVTLSTGITYDRQSIETWIESGNQTCPITNQVLRGPHDPIPNHTIRKMIQDWCVENRSYGIERIPTPRIPLSAYQVEEILSRLALACQRNDAHACCDLAGKLKALAKESGRNKRCIVSGGAGSVLSATFEAFTKTGHDGNVKVLEEVISAVAIVFPVDEDSKIYLGSDSSLRCMVWLLKCGSLSGRRNSALVLKEILSSELPNVIDSFEKIEGSLDALVKVIKEPICPTTTKASLVAIYHMVSSPSMANEKIIVTLVEMGLIEMLLEMLVDSDRSICEKALGVLDGISVWGEGRERAYKNSLTMPVLVKKLLRVSDLATEFSVSIIWKLSKNEEREDGGVLVEALQVGAFQKLLLLLQVGCSESTKEKASELLKLLNLNRERLIECIDSMDFKDLKRPF